MVKVAAVPRIVIGLGSAKNETRCCKEEGGGGRRYTFSNHDCMITNCAVD